MKKKVPKKKNLPVSSPMEKISHTIRGAGMGVMIFTLALVGINGFAADTALGNLRCIGFAWGATCATTAAPASSVGVIIGGVISVVLTLLGIIFLILTLYAGFLWMTASGEKEKVEKAQKILMQAVIGLIIVLAAQGFTVWVLTRLATDIIK